MEDENFGKYHYNRGKIYKLCCKDANITDIYVGSTLNHYKRKHGHKKDCNDPKRKRYNSSLYQFIRANGGFDNWDIIVLEEYDAENKNDLLWKEREWIERLKPSLNHTNRPIITHEEKKEYYEEYYEENKERILERLKEYRQNNKEKIKKRDKKYYEANREKLLEHYRKYSSEKVECEICKVSFRRDSLSKHKKTKKHINNLEQKSTEP